jgi:serine protease Do
VLTLLAQSAFADDVSEWVHARIKVQRGDAFGERIKIQGPLLKSTETKSVVSHFVPPSSLSPLVKKVKGSVVNIAVQNVGRSSSVGSGFIVHATGLVVTNTHVIKKAESILVRLADGRAFDAQILGRDEPTDVALLRIPEGTGLETVSSGDSDALEVGDWVMAIGNPYGLATSVSHGIVSATNREIGLGTHDEFLQTDVPMNPGNSGGPLFNMAGQVVGMSTAVVNEGQGLAFAVPINLIKELIPNLLDNGRVDRGWLGIHLQDSADGKAVMVTEVAAKGPAAQAHLRVGDRIIALNQKPATSYRQVARRMSVMGPGEKALFEVLRGNSKVTLEATLIVHSDKVTATIDGSIAALGLTLKNFDFSLAGEIGVEPGLRVDAVTPQGAAQHAGLAVGDIIVEVQSQPVSSAEAFARGVSPFDDGHPVLLKVRRAQHLITLTLKE